MAAYSGSKTLCAGENGLDFPYPLPYTKTRCECKPRSVGLSVSRSRVYGHCTTRRQDQIYWECITSVSFFSFLRPSRVKSHKARCTERGGRRLDLARLIIARKGSKGGLVQDGTSGWTIQGPHNGHYSYPSGRQLSMPTSSV